MAATCQKRNGSIDVLKLLFSLVIAALHFSISHELSFARGGYILVEGFFIITGYFLMASVLKNTDPDTGRSTARFLFRKFQSFALPLLFSAVIAFCVRIVANGYTLTQALKQLPFLLFEVFPLQVTGMAVTPSTGVSWYLSAMMIASAVLFPLAKKFRSSFVSIFCPLATALIYGNLCSRFGSLNPILQTTFGSWITAGVLRAVAGMCLGCIICSMVDSTKHIELSTAGRTVMSLISLLCFGGVTGVALFIPKTRLDYIALVMLFVLLLIQFSQKSLLSYILVNPFTKHLGNISLLIYLNHSCWATFIAKKLGSYSMPRKVSVYISLTVISCCIVYVSVLVTKLVWKKANPFIKKIFISSAE